MKTISVFIVTIIPFSNGRPETSCRACSLCWAIRIKYFDDSIRGSTDDKLKLIITLPRMLIAALRSLSIGSQNSEHRFNHGSSWSLIEAAVPEAVNACGQF